jgi:hypothetical protein
MADIVIVVIKLLYWLLLQSLYALSVIWTLTQSAKVQKTLVNVLSLWYGVQLLDVVIAKLKEKFLQVKHALPVVLKLTQKGSALKKLENVSVLVLIWHGIRLNYNVFALKEMLLYLLKK